jgi:methionyl-tRNA synthetase
MARPTFYITTPIYYVNDLPHIGHIFTTTICDALARYHRMLGDDVRFLTGTDEHGQNIERAARREGITPIELADRVVGHYRALKDKLDFSYDDFVRTTEPRHERGVYEMIRRLDAAGDLYAAVHEGWYCSPCETFYTEKELASGAPGAALSGRLCPVHETPVEWKSEENMFFRLSRYQQRLLDWYDSDPGAVRPASRLNEVRSFVAGGLRDLSVSRANLEWGIPFPGRPGQTVYVWLDALTNYISALGLGSGEPGRAADSGAGAEATAGAGAEPEYTALYQRYWTAGDVRMHMIGKDILRFHAVYWPAFLMSAGLPLPTTIWAHGWWQRDGRKVSKSAGNVVRPDEIIDRFGADSLRYFLLREMAFGQDANFSDEAVIDRYNNDLANDLGNTVSRLVTLSRRSFAGRTPDLPAMPALAGEPADLDGAPAIAGAPADLNGAPATAGAPADDNPLIEAARRAAADYRQAMDALAFQRALESLWRLLAEVNQYVVAHEPWKLAKSENDRPSLARVLWNGLEATRIVAVGLLPIMPRAAAQVLAAIGAPVPASLDAMAWGGTPAGAELPPTSSIFPRIDKEAYVAEAQQPPTPASPIDKPEAHIPAASPATQGEAAAPAGRLTAVAGPSTVVTPAAGVAPPAAAASAASPAAAPPSDADTGSAGDAISIDTFKAVHLRVGTVLAAEPVPKSKKLLKLTVDLGAETRTVVAGIALAYRPEDVVGKQVVVIANLAPAKLMGVESQGMVLAASIGGDPVLLHPARPVPAGTEVR